MSLSFRSVFFTSVHLPRLTWPIVDFFYPGRCAACETPSETMSRLCESCDGLLRKLEMRPACRRCGAPAATTDAPCPRCRDRGMRPFQNIAAVGIYADPMRDLVHRIKYRHDWPLAESLAARLAHRPAARTILDRAQVIVPVPLHPLRHLTRGYNQADVIARKLADQTSARVAHPLSRVRNTHTQTDLHDLSERVKNVRDAFRLRRKTSHLTGKHVVVIDDVMTTGATLRAAARTLFPLRPASLSAMVLAIADPRGRAFETI